MTAQRRDPFGQLVDAAHGALLALDDTRRWRHLRRAARRWLSEIVEGW